MKKRSKLYTVILSIIVLTQLCIIFLLSFHVYRVRERIIPIIQNIIRLPVKYYEANNNDRLRYFYEPKTSYQDHPTWLGYTAFYSINNDQLNSTEEYTVQKPNDVFRIITLGDSHTFGIYVNTIDNYPSKLEALLNKNCTSKRKYQVLNFGVGGYDLSYSAERFKIRGTKYNPDLVIWYINEWNLEDINEFTRPKMSELVRGGVSFFDANTQTYTLAQKAREQLYLQFGDSGIKKYQLEVFRSFLNTYTGKLVFIKLNTWESDLFEKLRKMSKDIEVVEIESYLEDPKLRLFDFHPNSEGYTFIAESIYKNYLRNILHCR